MENFDPSFCMLIEPNSKRLCNLICEFYILCWWESCTYYVWAVTCVCPANACSCCTRPLFFLPQVLPTSTLVLYSAGGVSDVSDLAIQLWRSCCFHWHASKWIRQLSLSSFSEEESHVRPLGLISCHGDSLASASVDAYATWAWCYYLSHVINHRHHITVMKIPAMSYLFGDSCT